MADKIGDPRKQHPIPMRLRNPLVGREEGGSLGYRGPGWAKARLRALRRAGYKSQISGLAARDTTLSVDHIIPYRFGFTPHTNQPYNLRVADEINNPRTDLAASFKMIKRPRRRMRTF